jgi:hypothetical protein
MNLSSSMANIGVTVKTSKQEFAPNRVIQDAEDRHSGLVVRNAMRRARKRRWA